MIKMVENQENFREKRGTTFRERERETARERETQPSFMNGFPSFDLMVIDLVDRSSFPFLHLLIVLLFISLQIPTVRNLLSFSDFEESSVLIQNFATKFALVFRLRRIECSDSELCNEICSRFQTSKNRVF